MGLRLGEDSRGWERGGLDAPALPSSHRPPALPCLHPSCLSVWVLALRGGGSGDGGGEGLRLKAERDPAPGETEQGQQPPARPPQTPGSPQQGQSPNTVPPECVGREYPQPGAPRPKAEARAAWGAAGAEGAGPVETRGQGCCSSKTDVREGEPEGSGGQWVRARWER